MIFRSSNQLHLGALLTCLLLVWISYSDNSNHELLHWDDITYITTNPWVTDTSWSGISDLFTSFHLQNWHPFTWLSYIPDYYLCGNTASCYKLTNTGLHAVNAFLVYCLCWLMINTLIPDNQAHQSRVFIASIISASLFAVHPLHAESVIWAAERKDLLSSLFYLLSIIFYIRLHNGRDSCRADMPFLFFCFSLFSKPMAVSLPIVLLLLDVYPLQRFASRSSSQRFHICFIEKIHYYITALAVLAITIISQGVVKTVQPPVIDKINISISAVQHYLLAFFYPFTLSPFYPMEILNTVPQGYLYLSGFLGMLFIAGLVMTRQKVLLLVFTFFLIALLPVIGIIKVGEQAYADRYTYLPMTGFYLLTGYLAAEAIFRAGWYRVISISAIPLVILLLALHTHQYKDVWRSDLSLWDYVVSKYPHSSTTAHQNLGNSYYELGNFHDAAIQYTNAIELNKHKLSAYSNLALAYGKLGENEKSLDTYMTGITNNPENPLAYIQAGDYFYADRQYKRAFDYYKRSIEVETNYPYGLLRLGRLFIQLGDIKQSIRVLESVPADSPVDLEAKLLLAQAHSYHNKDIALGILTRLKKTYGYGYDGRIDKQIEQLE